jgi:hypothetical protein
MHLVNTLLLGHLIADFPLQTNGVYRLKNRHWSGILLHAAIHVVATGLLLQETPKHWRMLVALGAMHFVTDWLKLRIPFKLQSVGFVLDQMAHILGLLLLAAWWPDVTGTLPTGLLYPALAYAFVPVVLMLFSVAAGDISRVRSTSPSWMTNNAPILIVLSQAAGVPLVVGTVLARFGGL